MRGNIDPVVSSSYDSILTTIWICSLLTSAAFVSLRVKLVDGIRMSLRDVNKVLHYCLS